MGQDGVHIAAPSEIWRVVCEQVEYENLPLKVHESERVFISAVVSINHSMWDALIFLTYLGPHER